MKTVMLIAAIFTLTGCASVQREEYIGRDIRQVILDSGPPVNALDNGDGTRTFQFQYGAGSSVQATTTKVDNAAWFQSPPIAPAQQMVVNDDCVISYLTKWDGDVWRVSSYRIPKQRVC